MTVEELTELILAEWSASMSDDGRVWNAASQRLAEALAKASPEVKQAAYDAAYETRRNA